MPSLIETKIAIEQKTNNYKIWFAYQLQRSVSLLNCSIINLSRLRIDMSVKYTYYKQNQKEICPIHFTYS